MIILTLSLRTIIDFVYSVFINILFFNDHFSRVASSLFKPPFNEEMSVICALQTAAVLSANILSFEFGKCRGRSRSFYNRRKRTGNVPGLNLVLLACSQSELVQQIRSCTILVPRAIFQTRSVVEKLINLRGRG